MCVLFDKVNPKEIDSMYSTMNLPQPSRIFEFKFVIALLKAN